MIRRAIRWMFSIDAFERLAAQMHQMEVDRDAARDVALDLRHANEELEERNAVLLSLVRMLRDVNREMDRRIWKLEAPQ
jgi:hypothetical protein